MTAVAQQSDFVILADPGWDGLAVADLPIQALLRLPDDGGDARIAARNDATDLFHISRLEPRLFDISGVFVSQDPVDLVAISECVLDEMHVLANPDIDAFLFHEFLGQRVAFEVGAFKEGSKAGISLSPLRLLRPRQYRIPLTEDLGLSSNPRTSSRARDLIPGILSVCLMAQR